MPGTMTDDTPDVIEWIEATGFVATGRRNVWVPPRCLAGEIRAAEAARSRSAHRTSHSR